MSKSTAVLDVGAGEHPNPHATETLDIREDIAVDYPGVDISVDEWPLDDESVQHVICSHVLEHVRPERLGHVFRELDRVLVPKGMAEFEIPHAGTWDAATDLTHQGCGGTTPDIDRYFNADPGDLEAYWPKLDWDVRAYAMVQFPTFLRPSLRYHTLVEDGKRSMDWVKLPFVEAVVVVKLRKQDGGDR